ncbi:MAG TPA: O-antigen ligase family protein [Acidimicrobiales bacterium]|nr:O-antigen ligase family protein [Acidimicrobiales bacterium]
MISAVGVPGWALVAGGLIWVLMVLLWVTGATKGSFALFLGTLLCAAVALAWLVVMTVRGKQALGGARAGVTLVLAAAVPVIFDPHTGDVFNLPKYTVTVIGALVLAALWAVELGHNRALPRWRNGLQWLVGAIVLWTAVCAITSVDWRVSLLGNYASYDGLYAAAAFAVVMMSAAEALNVKDVRRALQAFAFVGGPVVAVYALIQLHDTEVHGSPWDFINWHAGSFTNQIFSTFGNPNHLGGFLAMLLPMIVVGGLGAQHWAARSAAGVFALVVLTELARTAARGAWLAAIAALLAVAIMLAPELRRRPLVTLGGAGLVVVVAVATLARFGQRFLKQPLSSMFQTGGASSVSQRTEIWATAARIAAHHPVVGTGPDTFAVVYPQNQSAEWVKDFGANYVVNGAHDIFMNVLADDGFVGLVLFVGLLLFVGLRTFGAWRRLRALERGSASASMTTTEAREARVLLAVVAASIVAYVVQAVFNVQQVGLSFLFWALVGISAALTSAAGVPSTLRPATVLRSSAAELPGRGGAGSVEARGPRREWTGRRRPGRHFDWARQWPAVVTGVMVLAAVVVLALGADAPYRADHDYWAAANSVTQGSATSTVSPRYFTEIEHAISLNPWEPTYPANEADVYYRLASSLSSGARASYMQHAVRLLAEAASVEPLAAPYPYGEAEVDILLAQLEPDQRQAEIRAAVGLARQAVKDNPRNPTYTSLLRTVLAAQAPSTGTKASR